MKNNKAIGEIEYIDTKGNQRKAYPEHIFYSGRYPTVSEIQTWLGM